MYSQSIQINDNSAIGLAILNQESHQSFRQLFGVATSEQSKSAGQAVILTS